MNESNYIEMFAKLHKTSPYSADAELIKHNDFYELISIDSFSEKEDFFTNTPPEIIGHNMAMASMTDILACGTTPQYMVQAWNIDKNHTTFYYENIAVAIEKVLNFYNAKLIGGDIGSSSPWSWTSTTIGYHATTPVTRQTSKRIAFKLYTTNTLGDANWAIYNQQQLPKIPLHEPLPAETLFATDSSGGFFDAIENFRRVNQGLVLNIELSKVSDLALPFLIGGIGEYALIYALPENIPHYAIEIGQGYFCDDLANNITLSQQGRVIGHMNNPPPDYRNIAENEWLNETIKYAKEITNNEFNF